RPQPPYTRVVLRKKCAGRESEFGPGLLERRAQRPEVAVDGAWLVGNPPLVALAGNSLVHDPPVVRLGIAEAEDLGIADRLAGMSNNEAPSGGGLRAQIFEYCKPTRRGAALSRTQFTRGGIAALGEGTSPVVRTHFRLWRAARSWFFNPTASCKCPRSQRDYHRFPC